MSKRADSLLGFVMGWVVDLGPEGGAGGGQVVAKTSPQQLAKLPTHTARALAAVFLVGRISQKRNPTSLESGKAFV